VPWSAGKADTSDDGPDRNVADGDAMRHLAARRFTPTRFHVGPQYAPRAKTCVGCVDRNEVARPLLPTMAALCGR
jgi:hypothetical protein